jgi:hypothetical protein
MLRPFSDLVSQTFPILLYFQYQDFRLLELKPALLKRKTGTARGVIVFF